MRRLASIVCALAAGCHNASPAKPDGPSGPTIDGSVSIADAPVTTADAPVGSPDGGLAATYAPIALPAEVSGIGWNHTSSRLYVLLGQTGAAGIAVLDTTNDSVLTTITGPTSPDTSAAANLDTIAIDETANKIYVADSLDRYIWVIDGATNTISAPLDTNPTDPVAVTDVTGLVVDPAKQQLYSSLKHSVGDSGIVVVDTSTFTLSSTTDITGMVSSHGVGLDTTNHLLFACGSTAAHEDVADAFDTNAGVLTSTSVDLGPDRGDLDTCKGGPGNVFALIGGSASSVWALEPLDLALPFMPTFFLVNPELTSNGEIEVVFMNVDDDNPNHETRTTVEIVRFGAGEPPSVTIDGPDENVDDNTSYNGVFGFQLNYVNLVLSGYAVGELRINDAGQAKGELVKVSFTLAN
jgi:hypothetical protein